jgi:uncharacterized protein (TIGR02646 family)
MRKLDRASVAAPECLANYQYGHDNWGTLKPEDRTQIREHLEQLQGRLCAYCEGTLGIQHIEHFRRRHDFPHLTFEWNNLYWSCYQEDSCGRNKDHRAGEFDVDDLIDPCIDDPDVFFRFRADGTISIRPGLQDHQKHRAEETLRVFNLNPEWGRLRYMRKAAVSGYIELVADCAPFSMNELNELLEKELSEAKKGPFYTAIRHVLTEP